MESTRYCFRSDAAKNRGKGYGDRWKKCFNTFTDEARLEMFNRVIREVNYVMNNYHDVDTAHSSYSKSLLIPLYKYYHDKDVIKDYTDSDLIISEVCPNTIYLKIQGEFEKEPHSGQYHLEKFEVMVPVERFFSSEPIERIGCKLKELGYAGKSTCYRNINFCVDGFTLDIFNVDKKGFEDYYRKSGMWDCSLDNPWISYKRDQEVISTKEGISEYRIESPDVIQLVRFLTLLRIGNESERFDGVMGDILENQFPDLIVLSKQEREAVKWISNYLQEDNLKRERENYNIIFGWKGLKLISPEMRIDYSKPHPVREVVERNAYRFFRTQSY